METMKKLILKDVTKKFGNFVAVDKVNIEIDDQEFIVLVGPSGCGKTTTLRMIAGLEDADEGEIYINRKLVNKLPAKARDIAMVFQSYALYPHMTIYKNMAFGLKMRKIPKQEIDRQIHETAKILGIENLLDRKPRQLSGGQRQRVALGRAIVRKPEAFLFDEPLSNLDAKLRVQMRTELKLLQKRLKATVVYVTHDQVEAMTMGDRIVIIKDGKIHQIGTPLEVYNKPVNTFVAGFIGSPAMNFLPCRIKENNSKLFIDTGEFQIPLSGSLEQKVRESGQRAFTFGVRPEDLYVRHPDSNKKSDSIIVPTVNVVETLGREIFLDLSLGPQSLSAIVPPDTKASANQKIYMEIDLGKVHLFNTQDGLAII